MTGPNDSPATEHVLIGLDGSNPLAFLAALGTVRSLTLARPDRRVRLSWRRLGPWRPVLYVDDPATRGQIVTELDERLKVMRDHQAWTLGPNLGVRPDHFRNAFARPAAQQVRADGDRTWADFVAAFGCEAMTDKNALKETIIQDTALRTMAGAGHQHFLLFMQRIVDRTESEHLAKTLWQPWLYDDPVENQTLRWDPADDVRRAHRWRDPSGDPERRRRGGMLGANRLAIEGLPLLPTVPVGTELRTTGFARRPGEGLAWTWPIWSDPLPLDVLRSALALPDLHHDDLTDSVRLRLQALGIVEVYRSRRLTVGKYRAFTPARPI